MYDKLVVESVSESSRTQSPDTQSLASLKSALSSARASTIWSLENESVSRIPRLNDQQWIMQRKKIGLSRNVKRMMKNKESKERSKSNMISFIETNFKRKECVSYVHNENGRNSHIRPRPCYCGAMEREHRSVAEHKNQKRNEHEVIREEEEEEEEEDVGSHGIRIKVDRDLEEKEWKENLAIREFPTNAFGKIEFDGRLTLGGKYIRLSNNTDMNRIKMLLTDHWEMLTPRPRLVLGVIGGAQNFKLEGRKRETFKSGLIAAVKATNGWLMSAGTNSGVMKLVGEAVEEGQFLVSDGPTVKRGIKAIGLCNWGMVENNLQLINKSSEEINSVNYVTSVDIKENCPVPLNPNHTHFFLVDTGHRYTFKGVGEFIGRFEKMLSAPAPSGLGIPVVNLVVEGGIGALTEVREFLHRNQMVVIVEGTGRMADILGYAFRHAVHDYNNGPEYKINQKHLAHIRNMLTETYGRDVIEDEKQLNLYTDWILECIQKSESISVFDIRFESNLDYVILSSLLRGNDLNIYSQLYLALVWNRLDIAEERIFSNRTFEMKQDLLSELMLKALLMDRKNFVEALVVNGFSMQKFLTVENLRELYEGASKEWPHLLDQISRFVNININNSQIYLRTIHKYILFVWKKHKCEAYEMDVPPSKRIKDEVLKNSKKTFDQPFLELFIWAVLTKKPELLEYFWQRSGSPVLAALFASSVYYKLVQNFKLEYDNEILNNSKEYWLKKANDILEVGFSKDKMKTVNLVERKHKRFEGRSIIKLAFSGGQRGFINNPTCQEAVRSSWQRGIVHMNPVLSILAIFFPLLVLTPAFVFLPLGDDGGSLNICQKMFVFYKAPIIKFYGDCISYTIFVILHTYIALFNFSREFQYPELVLYAWFLIMILDEIRQLFSQPSKKLGTKIYDHLDNVWNSMDAIIYCFAITAVVLKLFPATFSVARVVFATNNFVLYIRFLRVFHIRWDIGPKVVIMYRMVPELVSFMMLLVIFILAYGTASQALLNPSATFQVENLYLYIEKIVWLPYWQMYGELSLHEIVPKNNTEHCQQDALCEDVDLYSKVIPFFLGVYLLIGNVMLLNLLIAIFTSVYDQVSAQSKEVWRWEMFRLATEYDGKPGLAAPFVIIEDIWVFLKSCWKKTCRRHKEDLEALMAQDLEMLNLFEKDCLHDYIARKKESVVSNNDLRLTRVEESVQKVLKLLEDVPDHSNYFNEDLEETENVANTVTSRVLTARVRSHSSRTQKSLTTLERRLEAIEEKTNENLEKIERNLSKIKKKHEHEKTSKKHRH